MIIFFFFNFHRYSIYDDFTEPPIPQTTYPAAASTTNGPFYSSSSTSVNSSTSNSSSVGGTGTTTPQNSNTIPYGNGTTSKPISRKGGIIFPSVKNKPSVVNSTFATDALSYKDVKVSLINYYFLVLCNILLNSRVSHVLIFKMLV